MLCRARSLAIAAATFLGAYFWQYSFCETQTFSCSTLVQTGYVFNGIVAFGVIVLVAGVNSPRSLAPFWGFLLGSLLKALGFFVLVYPEMKADGSISRPEFFTFFIPYIIALFWETYFLMQASNKAQ